MSGQVSRTDKYERNEVKLPLLDAETRLLFCAEMFTRAKISNFCAIRYLNIYRNVGCIIILHVFYQLGMDSTNQNGALDLV